jgi:hypothetical protein
MIRLAFFFFFTRLDMFFYALRKFVSVFKALATLATLSVMTGLIRDIACEILKVQNTDRYETSIWEIYLHYS